MSDLVILDGLLMGLELVANNNRMSSDGIGEVRQRLKGHLESLEQEVSVKEKAARKFYKFDLQTIGVMQDMFRELEAKGDISIEHKNKAIFFSRYCKSLQTRIAPNVEMEK